MNFGKTFISNAFLQLLLLMGATSFAADSSERSGEIIRPLTDYQDQDGWTELEVYSSAQKAATCKKYDNRYIGYYGTIYKVEDCKRRQLVQHEQILKLGASGINIETVESDVIAMLEEGRPLYPRDLNPSRKRGCKELEGKYVTYNFSQFFYIKDCKKISFPDYETFVEHRKETHQYRKEPVELTKDEYDSLPAGPTLPSVLDAEFQSLLRGDAGVDVIPIDEACEGLEGKIVSYYSRLYKIEDCHRREYDPRAFLRKDRTRTEDIEAELTSQQWLSLPEGKPMPTPEINRGKPVQ